MEKVERFAMQHLAKGRKDWDVPHTRAVVHYATELAEAVGLDVLVLETAAWLHDIGYYGLLSEEESKLLSGIGDKKVLHMVAGANMAERFLKSDEMEGVYNSQQIQRIVHLISVHDKTPNLKDLDELALMEADVLGALDLERVKPTFDKAEGLRYLHNLRAGKMLKFTTGLGKKYLAELLPRFEEYFAQM